MAKVSVIIPVWSGMDNSYSLAERCIKSVLNQSFQDFEIIITDDSDSDELKGLLQYPVKYFKNKGDKGMANNTNHGIDRASGDLVKILFQDDYFYHKDSLSNMVMAMTPSFNWIASACVHTTDGKQFFNLHQPFYSESENTVGSPSVVMFRNSVRERFDPSFHWVLDLDLYKRLHRNYGRPKMMNTVNIVIGIHNGQMTNKLSNEVKLKEEQELINKNESTSNRN